MANTKIRKRKSIEDIKVLGNMFLCELLTEYNKTGRVGQLHPLREKYGIFGRVTKKFFLKVMSQGLDMNDEKAMDNAVQELYNENLRLQRLIKGYGVDDDITDTSPGLATGISSKKVRVPKSRKKIVNVFMNNPVGVSMNPVDKLKFTPEGVCLYSLIHGAVRFVCVNREGNIVCEWRRNSTDDKMTRLIFTPDMKFVTGENALPVLFPDERSRDWSEYSPIKVNATPEIRMVCVKRDEDDNGNWVGGWEVATGIGGYTYVVRDTDVVSELKDPATLVSSEHCEVYRREDVLPLSDYESVMMSKFLGV